MAIPDDPHFDSQTIADLSRRFRRLSLPDRAVREIASYLDELAHPVDTVLVSEWLFGSPVVITQAVTTTVMTQKQTVTISKWIDDFSRAEMISILRQRGGRGRGISEGELRATLSAQGLDFTVATSKGGIVGWLASQPTLFVGGLMDTLRPRRVVTVTRVPVTTTTPASTRRLPNVMTNEEYLGHGLSHFRRGRYLRKKADLVLALLGEVTQAPQAGQEEATFVRGLLNLKEMEDAEIWPARKGVGFGGDAFLNEMWLRIVMYPKEDAWQIRVTYLQVYEAEQLSHTVGWPTRAGVKKHAVRSQATIDEILRRKMEYEAWKKAKRKKAALKRKLVSRQPAKGKKR
jgi:hypothetical protein